MYGMYVLKIHHGVKIMSTKKLLDIINNPPKPNHKKTIEMLRKDGDPYAADMLEAWLSGDEAKLKIASTKRYEQMAEESLLDADGNNMYED